MWYRDNGSVGGVRGPRIRLAPREVADLESLYHRDWQLVTGTGLLPMALGKLPLATVRFSTESVETFDSCQVRSAKLWQTRDGYRVTDTGVWPGPECAQDKAVQRAVALATAPDVAVSLEDDALVLESGDSWAAFRPAGPVRPPWLEDPQIAEAGPLFVPGSSWRVAEHNGEPVSDARQYRVQIGFGDVGTVSLGCGLEQVRLLAGPQRLAVMRTGRDHFGYNDYRAFDCNTSNDPESEAMLALMGKTFAAEVDWPSVILTRDGESGTAETLRLQRDGPLSLSQLYGATLTLVEATGLTKEQIVGIEGRPTRLAIGPTSTSGYDGCNHGSGPVQTVGEHLRTFGYMSHARGCSGVSMKISEAYHRVRAEDARYDVTENTLRVTLPNGDYSLYRVVEPE